MRKIRLIHLIVLALLLPSALLAATDGAATPAEAYRALQKAAEKRDAGAMAAVLVPEEREAFRAEVARAGAAALAGQVPKEALKIASKSADAVTGEAGGRAIRFVRRDSRWYVTGFFPKPKKPIAVLETAPSVRAEKGEVVTVAPIRGAGMPNLSAISGAKAYELLRGKARELRPSARLYTLDTGMHALSADGASSGWAAEFLTDTPGEMLQVGYEDGEIEGPLVGSAPPGRDGVPEPDAVGYDTKKLYAETMQHAAGLVDPITRVTAALYRSAGSGKALWLLDVYNDDDRIGVTVVFEARTMAFSHQTK